jgi:uncharacterized membrane protein
VDQEEDAVSAVGQPVDVGQHPVSMADEQAGFNGAIAAALTRAVGSMPALYVVLVIVGAWTALATWGPLHAVDPYPFPFLLFLDNVVQLALCLVILVGQRVLGAAADQRARQTYENAEAIFAQVADLQAHLDRHDQALSRGVSLLQSRPHPWIEQHRVQAPPQALDQAVSRNGRIGAWLTDRLGSMTAFYLAAATQVLWIGLAELGAQRFDPYPFAFMSFLSTLAQLLFMVIIMVGQDVLGRVADRRSEQTYLDAEAILHECRRMKARLTAQDRVIDSVCDYAATQVTEHLAEAIHDSYARTIPHDPAVSLTLIPSQDPTHRPWRELPEHLKEPTRAQAQQIGEKLAAIGCLMVPTFDPTLTVTFDDHEIQILARLEHRRRAGEHPARFLHPDAGHPDAGRTDTPGPDVPGSGDLPAWDDLPATTQARHLEAARRIPAMLAGVGFQILRDNTGHDGPVPADFTTDEWSLLQQAMMSAGVLVSLAEGVVDAEEIFALIKTLRDASVTHPDRLIRQLAAASTFNTGLATGTRYADYKPTALQTIRSATAVIARKAPGDLAAFQHLLVQIAAVVADANQEGGILGIGARARTPSEAAALQAVRTATGLRD